MSGKAMSIIASIWFTGIAVLLSYYGGPPVETILAAFLALCFAFGGL
jgi:hypothetical protein